MLKQIFETLTLLCIVGGIVFLGINMTGAAIAEISRDNATFLGMFLLVIGLVSGLFWVIFRKK